MSHDPLEVAVEHIAWEIRMGHSVADVFACLGKPLPRGATWHHAMAAIADAYDLGTEIRRRREFWMRRAA